MIIIWIMYYICFTLQSLGLIWWQGRSVIFNVHNSLSACCVHKGSPNWRWLGRALRSQHYGRVDVYLYFPAVFWKWRDNWRVSIKERLSQRTKESSMTPLPELALQWCWPVHVFRHCVQKLEGELKSQHHREGLSQRTKESLMTKVHVYQQEVHMQRQLIQVILPEHCFFSVVTVCCPLVKCGGVLSL